MAMKTAEQSLKPTIGIIGGSGKMGLWFKNFFQNLGFEVLISDSKTKLTNIELTKKADIVIVSVPVDKTIEVIKEVRSYVRKDALFCDLTSLKSKPVKAMKKANSGVLGIHPLFGPLVQNLEMQKIVFCKVKNNRWVNFLKKIFVQNGAEIVEISPEEHDLQMAIVQALTHFTNISLARTLYSQKIVPKSSFLTPIFRLQSIIVGRILGQDPKFYASIEIENPYFKKVLKDFKKQINDLAEDIDNKDYEGFIKKFEETSLYLDGFRKVAQTKSTEILRMIDKQPIKTTAIGTKKMADWGGKFKIGFLGPKGTFSHQAAIKVFSQKPEFVPTKTITEIFEKVNSEEIDIGIVPIENTIGGLVSETVNCLIKYPTKTSGSLNINVHQCLLVRTTDREKIEIVKSHPQALTQCKEWLENNLPQAKTEISSSTTAPILSTIDEKVGFIGSRVAADVYGLNILAKNIESTVDNITKFYLILPDIDKSLQKKLQAEKTLILFAIYDRVGVLRDILDVFAKNNLNLTSLHSIPSHLRAWDYFFFLEVDALYPSPKIKNVLKEMEQYCPTIRVLGVS